VRRHALWFAIGWTAVACGGAGTGDPTAARSSTSARQASSGYEACPAYADPDAFARALVAAAETDDEAAFVCQLSAERRERWASGPAAFPDQWAAWRKDVLGALSAPQDGSCHVGSPSLAGVSMLTCVPTAGDEATGFVVQVVFEAGGYRIDEN
jgi:hypothetical protein